MTTHDERGATAIRELAARSGARAAIVLVVLWVGTAIMLREANEFGGMIAILACASVVLWGPGAGWRYLIGQLVLWSALTAATVVLLWESPRLPGMLALFGVAAVWFVVAEPILRTRPAS